MADFNERTPAREALRAAIAWLDSEARDDDTLCSAALTIFEPLVDWHWATIIDELEETAHGRSDLRKAISCCWFDDSVPAEIQDRLHNLVEPDEDVGRRPTTDGA